MLKLSCLALSGEALYVWQEASPSWTCGFVVEKLEVLRPLAPRNSYRLVHPTAGVLTDLATLHDLLAVSNGLESLEMSLQVLVVTSSAIAAVVMGRLASKEEMKDRRQWAEPCTELGDGSFGVGAFLRPSALAATSQQLFLVHGVQVYEADLSIPNSPVKRLLGSSGPDQTAARDVPLSFPTCIAHDVANKTLWVADGRGVRPNGGKIWQVALGGDGLVAPMPLNLHDPSAIAAWERQLYVADRGALLKVDLDSYEVTEMFRGFAFGIPNLLVHDGILYINCSKERSVQPLRAVDLRTGVHMEVPFHTAPACPWSGLAVVRGCLVVAGERALWAAPLKSIREGLETQGNGPRQALPLLATTAAWLQDHDILITAIASDGEVLYIADATDSVVLHTPLPDLEPSLCRVPETPETVYP